MRRLALLGCLLLTAIARAQSPVQISWQPVALADGCTTVYYTLYHAPNMKGPYAKVMQGGASTTSFTYTGPLSTENFWILVASCAPVADSQTLASVAWKFP